MFQLWMKGWRRRRIVGQATPSRWVSVLEDRFWYWGQLNANQQRRLLSLIAIFLHEKEVVVPAMVVDGEAARLLVAASACLLLLGFDDLYCFDRVRTIVLSEGPFSQRLEHSQVDGLMTEVPASGVYSKGTPIRLSWTDVVRDLRRDSGRNVVIHEFAHHIDDLDGVLAGDPPFSSARLRRQWSLVSQSSMRQLSHELASGHPSVLDAYGLSSPVEFFAVTCEAFFCQPSRLSIEYGELFSLLTVLFRLDPRAWFPESLDEHERLQ